MEDYSDIAEADELEHKVADFKVSSMLLPWDHFDRLQLKNPTRRGLFHPDDINVYTFGPTSTGPKSAPLPNLSKKASRSSLGPLIAPSGGSNGPLPIHSRSASATSSGSFGPSEARQLQSQTDLEFGKYAEKEDDDYDDVFGKPSGASKFANAGGSRTLSEKY